MKIRIALPSYIALALVISAGQGVRASAAHRDLKLRASLEGLQEVPPIATDATATLHAELDESEQKLRFRLEYRNLTRNPTAAHIHFGPTKVNGGIVAFLCGDSQPACPAATSGTITGTITAADIVGPAAQGIEPNVPGNFAKLVRAIKTGNTYANIHNERFPTGEIRGQISAEGFDRDDDEDEDKDD